MFLSALVSYLVSFEQDYAKTIQRIFTKFDGKVAHRPREKPSDFSDNPDRVALGLWLRLDRGERYLAAIGCRYGRVSYTPRHWICFGRHLFISNIFARSAA